jgi:Predicted membrane protein
MRFRDEEGQAVLVVVVLSSVFLLGAVGLGVDGAHIYAQRQMAQTAADSAAIAGITSIYNGTNTTGSTAFSTGSSFTCSTTATSTPCVYARNNGFGGTAADTVIISFPTSAPGVTLSPDFPVNLVKATITRNVDTTLLRMLGTSVSSVTATATAAIVYVAAPVPILVTHPTLASSLFLNGNPTVQICGGPRRSIQVNSNAGTASGVSGGGGSAVVDLSKAGPADTSGTCTTGTGADFGSRGGPTSTYPPLVGHLGTTGHYVQPDDLMPDPLANVAPPTPTGWPTITPPSTTYSAGSTVPGGGTCPSSAGPAGCTLWDPGVYNGGINFSGTTALMKPGIYYINGAPTTGSAKGAAFYCHAGCAMQMATGFTDTTTGTGWTGNVMFYATGTGTPVNSGFFNVTGDGSVNLVGAPAGSSYKGILFFEDRNSKPHNNTNSPNDPHLLGGNGDMHLQGTIYLNNTTMTSTQYQQLDLQGKAGSGTTIQGEIIVSVLNLGGTGTITMNLNSNATLVISQIALVN